MPWTLNSLCGAPAPSAQNSYCCRSRQNVLCGFDRYMHTHTHPDGVGTLINQLFGLADPCVGGEGRGSRSHSLAGRVEVEKSSDIHVIEA